MDSIDVTEFARRFKRRVVEQNASVIWFVGAGCSVTSKIPAAGGLARLWLQELYQIKGGKGKIEDWARKAFPGYDDANPAAHYSDIFGRLHPTPAERQQEIERICSHGEPFYGYGTFAQILSSREFSRNCNTVLTTNFDDLIADAVYLYGDRRKKPLIIAHEALARYVRIRSDRPKIFKLHGDAMLDPKNLPDETSEIQEAVSDVLSAMLQENAVVFIGYGGHDRSVCRFLNAFSNRGLLHPVFWIGGHDPCEDMANWLNSVSALRVDHSDFDSLMHILRGELDLELIGIDAWMKGHNDYMAAYEKFEKEGVFETNSKTSDALESASKKAEKWLADDWLYASRAYRLEKMSASDAEKAYRDGLNKHPASVILLGSYAVFLKNVRKDMDAAETFYKRAIEADPAHVTSLGNYALFLKNVRKDMDAAETFYKRAIEADPAHANNLGNYALFLDTVRKDMDAAETFYKRAIEADPAHANNLGNYALFLDTVRKDMDAAETFYKRAIEADPAHVTSLGNYASFLKNFRKDMDAAEAFYKRAIEADPADANNLGNYASFLSTVRKDMDAAETYYKRAIEADPAHANNLGNYASFLSTVGKDMDAAETFYKRAIEADPAHATSLGNYASFLSTVRKDMDAAETFYKRAIEADPAHANNLGNYASFLSTVRKDMDAAETFHKRAIEADPADANSLGNYAQLLFGVGNTVEGTRALQSALTNTNASTPKDLLVELNTYRFAHVPNEAKDALKELKRQISSGGRSLGWDFSLTLGRAAQDGCQNVELLRALIDVISNDADLNILDAFPEWRSIPD